MPYIQRTSPTLVLFLIHLVRPHFCWLGVGWDVDFSRTARPASPSQKRKTPDSDLANNDLVVSSFRASISPTLTPISHVRPPTSNANLPAPHRVPIHVPPVTRTSLPLFPSDNMLLQVEVPTKHVASPSNTGSNNWFHQPSSRSLRLCLSLTLTLPYSLPRCAPPAMT